MFRSIMYETIPSGWNFLRTESAAIPIPIRSSERNRSRASSREIMSSGGSGAHAQGLVLYFLREEVGAEQRLRIALPPALRVIFGAQVPDVRLPVQVH